MNDEKQIEENNNIFLENITSTEELETLLQRANVFLCVSVAALAGIGIFGGVF